MSLQWIHEPQPRWDSAKARIVGGAPEGAFDLGEPAEGDAMPGDWWRVQDGDDTVGYGWMDVTWNGAEILLAVDPGRHGQGIGTFILDHLDAESARHGLEYMFNTVREGHAKRDETAKWLEAHGFEGSSDGELRRRVKTKH